MGRVAHRSGAANFEPVRIAHAAPLAARFVRRYKRFFADVELPDGRILTVHCPNSGSMLGFDRPGAPVRCSTSDSARRKLRHTLEMMRIGRIWVGLHSARANAVVARALAAGVPPGLAGYRRIEREVCPRIERTRGVRARIDFRLADKTGDPRPCFVEVKSVTLAERGIAMFPDSVTERGLRHVETLRALVADGARAALVFCVQRGDCHAFALAEHIDADYAAAVRDAARAGVELFALATRVGVHALRVEREIPVQP